MPSTEIGIGETNFSIDLIQFNTQNILSTYETQNNQKDTSKLPITENKNIAFSQFETQNFETYEPEKLQTYNANNTTKPIKEIKVGSVSENAIPFEIDQLIKSSSKQESAELSIEIPNTNYSTDLLNIDIVNLYLYD